MLDSCGLLDIQPGQSFHQIAVHLAELWVLVKNGRIRAVLQHYPWAAESGFPAGVVVERVQALDCLVESLGGIRMHRQAFSSQGSGYHA